MFGRHSLIYFYLALHLDQPTEGESISISTLNSNAWKDTLPLDIYLKESAHLMTVPLAKDGGMTRWIPVDNNLPPVQRLLLASCETFRKRSWISDPNGNVTQVITHRVASVYTDPKGWWQTEATKCAASVLFSDIGKRFYGKLGRHAFPIHQVGFVPSARHPRSAMATPSLGGKTRFMISPDHEHMLWHHSKEEFAGETLFRKKPEVKGAIIGYPANRVWAVWTHRFYEMPDTSASKNTLHTLRIVIENQDAVLRLVKKMGLPHRVEDREEGICSLRWYGGGNSNEDEDEIEWIGNEKYGWC
ncbi:hypothetical protein BDW59DRAFT_176084 [Aspergillus cavernicola]|uniref:LYC1 C-terminal domain-containing protein n=1 Tax=Aspergillus cavernicola TaxID=176166 RepID=A0ABR4HJB3_9EURO